MAGETHTRYRVERGGAAPEQAVGAVVMIHGRGASARDILSLAPYLQRDDLLYIAPQAPGGQWYPFPFMQPLERNEPGITNSMRAIDDVRATLAEYQIGPEHTAILGFSQGACLSVEYAARHAERFAGVFGLSGGLIGPDGTPRDYAGSLSGTPVFLGCSDVDPHIPLQRVLDSAEVLERLGAQVTTKIYPGMP